MLKTKTLERMLKSTGSLDFIQVPSKITGFKSQST